MTNRNRDNNHEGEQHPSYLITYEHDFTEFKQMSTLYMPFHGESIISEYGNDLSSDGKTSWVNLTFGKCAQTSD